MGNSLQDQLLKAGLVDEQKLKQTRASKRKKVRQHPARSAADDEARKAADQAQREKRERDQALNRKRQEEAARKAAENEIRQLIHTNRVVREGGDLAFNFTDGSTLKRIYVNSEQHAKLVAGGLAVVRQDAFYELVPAVIAERLIERDPSLVLVFNHANQRASDEDDPYADYQVPDDLMW